MRNEATAIVLLLTLVPPLLLVGSALGQGCEGKEAYPNTECVAYKDCDGVGQGGGWCSGWEWVDPWDGYLKCLTQAPNKTDECGSWGMADAYDYGDCVIVGAACLESPGTEGECDYKFTDPCDEG